METLAIVLALLSITLAINLGGEGRDPLSGTVTAVLLVYSALIIAIYAAVTA